MDKNTFEVFYFIKNNKHLSHSLKHLSTRFEKMKDEELKLKAFSLEVNISLDRVIKLFNQENDRKVILSSKGRDELILSLKEEFFDSSQKDL